MRHTLEELSTEEMTIIALAVEHFLCNCHDSSLDKDKVEELFAYLDIAAELAEEADPEHRLVAKTDNVLVVDFRPKSD
jgi:hypothetical protein